MYPKCIRRLAALLAACLFLLGCSTQSEPGTADTAPAQDIDPFIRGMDTSSLLAQLNSGVTYYDFQGNALDGPGFFRLLADCGVNWIRLRVWNDPYDGQGHGYGGGNCDLAAAITMGTWATQAGLRVFIDFHYSDFWADPEKQLPPKAWTGLSAGEKAAALEDYTRKSLEALMDAGVDVGMVQLGNETNYGFCGETDWAARCDLYQAGTGAVRAVAAAHGTEIRVVLHFTDPQNPEALTEIAGVLADHNVDYDVFAVSYYPFWHGTAENLTAVLTDVAQTWGKEVLVAETAWPYTLEDGDGHPNNVDAAAAFAYPCDVRGQALALQAVAQAVAAVGSQGLGLFYWEPAWIPVGIYDGSDASRAKNAALWEQHGSGWAASYAAAYARDAGQWYGGSSWDNMALFDHLGQPLSSLAVFRSLPAAE